MTRRFTVLAAMFLLVLAGCSASQDDAVQEALNFRTSLLAAESCTFSADVTADYGERVGNFNLDCTYAPATNEAELTVTAPEAIAGISASVDGEAADVTFEDVSLELGTLAGGQVAPLQLPQLLGDAWTYGYVESQSEEGDGYLVTYRCGYDQEERLVFTRFDSEMTPLQAEIYCDGVCVLTAALSGFAADGSGTVPERTGST